MYWEGFEGGIIKGREDTFQGDGHASYLHCGDFFHRLIYVSKHEIDGIL